MVTTLDSESGNPGSNLGRTLRIHDVLYLGHLGDQVLRLDFTF